MSTHFQYHPIPRSRIATFDVLATGKKKHHVAALLEFDVTEGRKKLKEAKKGGSKVSFTAWLLKVVATAVEMHPEAAAFLAGKRKLITFQDINISLLIEKKVKDKKVPLPLVIERVNRKNLPQITLEIENALSTPATGREVVLQKRATRNENLYYRLPGFLRRLVWKIMLKNPRFAFSRMGNVSFTSLAMMGKINGWFVHTSVHPLSVGVGSVISKPRVVNGQILVREILNATLLLDHDVIDGAPMVRFVNDLTRLIDEGAGIDG